MMYYCVGASIILISLTSEMAVADSANSKTYPQTIITLTENSSGSFKMVVGTKLNIFLKTSSEDLVGEKFTTSPVIGV
jgi:hypothetical protein